MQREKKAKTVLHFVCLSAGLKPLGGRMWSRNITVALDVVFFTFSPISQGIIQGSGWLNSGIIKRLISTSVWSLVQLDWIDCWWRYERSRKGDVNAQQRLGSINNTGDNDEDIEPFDLNTSPLSHIPSTSSLPYIKKNGWLTSQSHKLKVSQNRNNPLRRQ